MCRLALAIERKLVQEGEQAGPATSRAVLTAVVPLFTDDRPTAETEAPATVFRAGEAKARENILRDAELWPRAQ